MSFLKAEHGKKGIRGDGGEIVKGSQKVKSRSWYKSRNALGNEYSDKKENHIPFQHSFTV